MLSVAVREPGKLEIVDIPKPTAAQEPLIEWIRAGRLSHRDFLTGEFPVREVARALAASQQPEAIKTLLRFQ